MNFGSEIHHSRIFHHSRPSNQNHDFAVAFGISDRSTHVYSRQAPLLIVPICFMLFPWNTIRWWSGILQTLVVLIPLYLCSENVGSILPVARDVKDCLFVLYCHNPPIWPKHVPQIYKAIWQKTSNDYCGVNSMSGSYLFSCPLSCLNYTMLDIHRIVRIFQRLLERALRIACWRIIFQKLFLISVLFPVSFYDLSSWNLIDHKRIDSFSKVASFTRHRFGMFQPISHLLTYIPRLTTFTSLFVYFKVFNITVWL